MRETKKLDRQYKSDSNWRHRIIVTLFRKHFCQFAAVLLSRAYERNCIDSYTLHEMAAIYQDMARSK